jgi:DNA-directed RNA polymerase specialized sigma subunit
MRDSKPEILIDGIRPMAIPKPDANQLVLRRQQMLYLRNEKHMTLEAIAKLYGISRQRVFQILRYEIRI